LKTTLDVDEDVLEAARAIAGQNRKSIGKLVSELARRALKRSSNRERNGILLLAPKPGVIVTLDDVNMLRDELP
jgi:hypothetical protein